MDRGPISHLRDSLLAAGYNDAAKWVNVSIHRHEQKWFEYLLFDATSEWGANWARPLKLIGLISAAFAILYWVSMHFGGRGGIYLVATGQTIVTSAGREHVRRLSARHILTSRPIRFRRALWLEARAFRTSVLFSLMSAFNIGFRDFNFGRWIRMLQTRDFDLRASGWIRTASGIQSLLGVGLAALSLLSYFGHPFQ